MILALASGAWIFLAFLVVFIVVLGFAYFSRTGSGISQTPYRGTEGEQPSDLAHDRSQHVSDWGRGTSGHHARHRPEPTHEPADPEIRAALVSWRRADGAHGRLDPPVGPGDHARGPEDAPEVVLYVDLSAPACGEAARAVSDLARRRPVREVVRHLPLADAHPLALPCAEALEAAADQGAFWALYDALAAAPPRDEQRLLGVAAALVDDPEPLRSDIRAGRHRAAILADVAEAAASGAHGVPAVYIRGRRHDGELDAAALAAALGEADALS